MENKEISVRLINDAIGSLMILRLKSKTEEIDETQLFDVQMILFKALDNLNPLDKSIK